MISKTDKLNERLDLWSKILNGLNYEDSKIIINAFEFDMNMETALGKLEYRTVYIGSITTREYNWSRINYHLDKYGTIRNIDIG